MPCAGDGWDVLTTAVLPDAVPIDTVNNACSIVRDLLALYAGLTRPVRTSRAWSLPSEEPSNLHTNVGHVAHGHHDELFEEAAAAVDATTRIKVPRGGPDSSHILKVTIFERSAGWHDEEVRRHLYFMLGCGDVFPPNLDAIEDSSDDRLRRQAEEQFCPSP